MSGRGIVEAEVFRSEQVSRLARTSDPSSPAKGDAWIRTDVQPVTNSVAALRIQGDTGYLEAPLFDPSATLGSDVYVGKRFLFDNGTEGHLLVTDQGGAVGSPRIVTSAGTLYEAHDALEVNVIPDSGLDHFYWSQELSSPDPWPDEEGTEDADAFGAPTLVPSGINGYQSIEEEGTDDRYETTNDAPLGASGEYTTVAIFQTQNTTTIQSLFVNGDNQSGYRLRIFDDGTFEIGHNGVASYNGGTTDTNPHVIVATYNGSNVIADLDGSEIINTSASAPTSPSGAMSIGGFVGGGGEFDGFLGAAGHEAAAADATRRDELTNKLADPFDIPVST